jgi:glycerol-3-phosphate dehydrogenase subunit C
MLKFEWPLILPGDAGVQKLSDNTWDVAEYIVDIAKKEGVAPGMQPVPGGVAVHLACHARAQNIGPKAADMLRLIPDADVQVIERCSGHGGSWGMMKGNFEVALKVGRPVARAAVDSEKTYIASECPLAAIHIGQGMQRIDGESTAQPLHPIQIVAKSYGLS